MKRLKITLLALQGQTQVQRHNGSIPMTEWRVEKKEYYLDVLCFNNLDFFCRRVSMA